MDTVITGNIPAPIEEIGEKGVIRVALSCTNQKNEVVVRGKAVVKKLKEIYRPLNPAA